MATDYLKQYSMWFSTSTSESNGFNTWKDWHLVPMSRPSFSIKQIVTRFTELPISDWQIDESDAFGTLNYQAISGEIEFYMLPEYMKNWPSVYTDLLEFLHGRLLYVWLESEPDVAYQLRCAVNSMEHKADGSGTNIKIGYNGNPIKISR